MNTASQIDTWIVGDDDQLGAKVHDLFRHATGAVSTNRMVRVDSVDPRAELFTGFAGLVVLAVRRLESTHFDLLKRIRAVGSDDLRIIVVASISDQGNLLNAIRAGANDIVGIDDKLQEEFVNAVKRVVSGRGHGHLGRAISVVPCYSPMNANVMAVNLAVVIAKRLGSCVLLDFHMNGGDLALLLNLSPRHTMLDLITQQVTVDEAVFQQALTMHDSGVHLLASPHTIIDYSNVRRQVFQKIITFARAAHPSVIINLEDVQHAEQVRALADSDDIVIPIQLDVVSLHRAKQYIDFMTRNHVDRGNIHVVALDAGRSGELPAADVKKTLNVSAMHCIPSDPISTVRSINLGNPIVLESPRTKTSRAIVAFAESIVGRDNSPPQSVANTSKSPAKSAAALALSVLPYCK